MNENVDQPRTGTEGDWYIQRGSDRFRAPDLTTLKAWCSEGRVRADDLIFHPSVGPEWQRAGVVPQLADAFRPAPAVTTEPPERKETAPPYRRSPDGAWTPIRSAKPRASIKRYVIGTAVVAIIVVGIFGFFAVRDRMRRQTLDKEASALIAGRNRLPVQPSGVPANEVKEQGANATATASAADAAPSSTEADASQREPMAQTRAIAMPTPASAPTSNPPLALPRQTPDPVPARLALVDYESELQAIQRELTDAALKDGNGQTAGRLKDFKWRVAQIRRHEGDEGFGWKYIAALRPADARPSFNAGAAFGNRGDWGSAQTVFDSALSDHRDDAQLYFGLGVALEHLGKWFEARKAFEGAVRLQPGFTEAQTQLEVSTKKAVGG